MPHSQGFSNNYQPKSLLIPIFIVHSNLSSHLRLGLPKATFPVGLPVKSLKAPSSIRAT